MSQQPQAKALRRKPFQWAPSWTRGRQLFVVGLSLGLIFRVFPAGTGFAQNSGGAAMEPASAGPEFGNATQDQQIELLRRLLGVEAPKPRPVPQRDGAASSGVEDGAQPLDPAGRAPAPSPLAPAPAADSPKPDPKAAPAKVTAPKPKPQPAPKAPAPKAAPTKPKPAAKVSPKPAKASPQPAAAASQPKAAAKPKPKRDPVVASPTPQAAASDPALEASEDLLVEEAPAPEPALPAIYGRIAQLSETDLPPAGTVIDQSNVDRWSHVLTPSMQWAMHRNVHIKVIDPEPIVMETWRVDATEQYHAQVRLSEDGKSLENYVAGIPFPFVTEEDPQAAIKIMYNFENRIIIDDLAALDFECATGDIDREKGLHVQRAGRFAALRRLHFTGRLRIDPKPIIETPDDIRYRESLGPVVEPFNIKGAAFSYIRYQDSGRQDDAWLYLPATKRVRRLSTAQRSEGIFGTDVDLDSYGGFAGNPGWFDWQLLGKRTLLAPFHSDKDRMEWCAAPGNFMFCDSWEPREFYVIAARSLIPGYNFSLRVIYVDAQSMLIPFTEVYDHQGQLWRAYVQQIRAGLDRPFKEATESVYAEKIAFINAVSVFDMQLEHTSRCQFPAADSSSEGWYYWRGDSEGDQIDHFDIANFIMQGR